MTFNAHKELERVGNGKLLKIICLQFVKTWMNLIVLHKLLNHHIARFPKLKILAQLYGKIAVDPDKTSFIVKITATARRSSILVLQKLTLGMIDPNSSTLGCSHLLLLACV